MIKLDAPAPPSLRPLHLSARAQDIATAIRYAPTAIEAPEWPYTTHASRVPPWGRCPDCGEESSPVVVTITEALTSSVRVILTATYKHRCAGWTREAVAATIWETP